MVASVASKKKTGKKKCTHNIMYREKFGDAWLCCSCGKTLSDALVRKRMKGRARE